MANTPPTGSPADHFRRAASIARKIATPLPPRDMRTHPTTPAVPRPVTSYISTQLRELPAGTRLSFFHCGQVREGHTVGDRMVMCSGQQPSLGQIKYLVQISANVRLAVPATNIIRVLK